MRYESERDDVYKYSEFKWLGKIPKHWEVRRIKEVGRIKYGLSQPPQYLEQGLPLIRATNIERGKIVEKGLVFISPKDVSWERDAVLKENDIIVVRSGAYTADSAIVSEIYSGSIAGFDMVLRPYQIEPQYLAFTLLSNYVLRDQLILSSFRAAQPHLNKEELGSTLIVYPSIKEQKVIAKYLDTKTTQIDRKINLLTKKADKYSELKQSLINETVTRGLDKTVTMKESGIEWIGEVPEHWEKKRVKDLFVESKIKSVTGEETLLSVSEYSGVTQKKDNIEDGELLTNAATLIGYKVCKYGELVINIMLAWKRGLGVSAFDGIVSPSYAVYASNKSICSAYFHYLFRSDRAIAEFKRNSTGIIESRLRLYSDNFYAIHVAIPKYREQKAIADYLGKKISYIDRIIEIINTEIEKLKELRKTLINDVVTGKIKVTLEGEKV